MSFKLTGLAAVVASAAVLAGCATSQETNPARTATEQLLISHAAERAAQQFTLALPPGVRVFFDTTYFQGEGSDYAISALRETVLKQGRFLAPSRGEADVIVELRMGALSLDRMNRVLGIPRLTVPVSAALNTATIPELSLYSRRDSQGVAEFSAFAYDAKTGAPIAVGGRFAGGTRIRSHTLFMIFSWGQRQVRPGDPHLDPEPWWNVLQKPSRPAGKTAR